MLYTSGPQGVISWELLVERINSDLANTLGDQRVANSVILGAISAMMEECFLEGEEKADMDRVAYEAIQEHFAKKPAVAELNWKAYQLGKTSITVKFGARVK